MARAKIEDERKEQILCAFEVCVLRDGLSKTTLQNVATEVGLPRSLVRYFVGNRSSMVELLIGRMVERAEGEFLKPPSDAPASTLNDFLDMLFDRAFSNETSNGIIGELWYLAERDENIRERLSDMYGRITSALVEQMTVEKIGPGKQEREAVALALLSLAYGEASFTGLGLKKTKAISMRTMADTLVGELRNAARK
ncbi:MAG: TetR/AcrR family transcriptional regulator [Rhodobiaceae bacterium]|nr:TetR/AcrR family transcriptional regulator [Rhodobiaceae bacterium]